MLVTKWAKYRYLITKIDNENQVSVEQLVEHHRVYNCTDEPIHTRQEGETHEEGRAAVQAEERLLDTGRGLTMYGFEYDTEKERKQCQPASEPVRGRPIERRTRSMSRFYEMHLTVSGFKPQRAVAIEEAANEEWPFEELSNDGNELSGAGQSNLCGGEGEEEFAARLTLAVWRAMAGHARFASRLPTWKNCRTKITISPPITRQRDGLRHRRQNPKSSRPAYPRDCENENRNGFQVEKSRNRQEAAWAGHG